MPTILSQHLTISNFSNIHKWLGLESCPRLIKILLIRYESPVRRSGLIGWLVEANVCTHNSKTVLRHLTPSRLSHSYTVADPPLLRRQHYFLDSNTAILSMIGHNNKDKSGRNKSGKSSTGLDQLRVPAVEGRDVPQPIAEMK